MEGYHTSCHRGYYDAPDGRDYHDDEDEGKGV